MKNEDIIVICPVELSKNNLYFEVDIDDPASDQLAMQDRRTSYRQMYRFAEDMQRLMRERDTGGVELHHARCDTLVRLALMVDLGNVDYVARMARIGILSALVARRLGMAQRYCDYGVQGIGSNGIPA
jgi:hypothetical protein